MYTDIQLGDGRLETISWSLGIHDIWNIDEEEIQYPERVEPLKGGRK